MSSHVPSSTHPSSLRCPTAGLGRWACVVLALVAAVLGGAESAGAMTIHDVTTYGAPNDGTGDAAPGIRAALAAAGAGDVVYLPAGTYRLASRAPAPNADKAIFWLKSDITITGDGPSTVLRVADGMSLCDPSQDGFGVFVGPPGQAVDDLTLEALTIDGNAAGNPIPGPGSSCSKTSNRHQQRHVFLESGANLVIRDCAFTNTNARQVLHLGDNDDVTAVRDVTVLDNVFTDHVLDPNQDDHSSIYVFASTSQDGRNLIQGNLLDGDVDGTTTSYASQEATAIEVHGSGNQVVANTVRDYKVGANVAATRADSDDNLFEDNQFLAVSAGFNLWVFPDHEMRNAVIRSNRVEKAFVLGSDSFVDWKVVYGKIVGLSIENNRFINRTTGQADARKGRGIFVKGYAENVSIVGNIISRPACEAIRISVPPAAPSLNGLVVDEAGDALSGKSWVNGVMIHGNRIYNAGAWGKSNNGCAVGVHVLSSTSPTGYLIRNVQMTTTPGTFNRIRYVAEAGANTTGYAGIRLRGPIEDSTFEGTEMLDAVGKDFETPGSVDFDNVLIHHHDTTSSDDPTTQGIRGCGGSTWRTSENKLWTKSSTSGTCDSVTQWNL